MNSMCSRSQPLQQVELEGGSLRSPQSHRVKYITFFAFAIVLIAGGTIIWVLNIINIVPGPWSSVFGAIFTGVGMIIALFNALLALTLTRRSSV